jgi:hypothetical protein
MTVWVGLNWLRYTDQWEVPANKMMKFQVPQKAAIFRSDEELVVSQVVFCGTERRS